MFISVTSRFKEVTSFDLKNLIQRIFLQSVCLLNIILFTLNQSLFTSILFTLTLLFYSFNFDFKSMVKFNNDDFINNISHFYLEFDTKSKFLIANMFGVSLAFFLIKIAIIFASTQQFDQYTFLIQFSEKISRFVFPFQQKLDFFCLFLYVLVLFYLLLQIKKIKIYYNYTIVSIYRHFFTEKCKQIILFVIILSVVIEKLIYFRSSSANMAETVVVLTIIVFLLNSLNRKGIDSIVYYTEILRKIYVFKLMLYMTILTITLLFNIDVFQIDIFKMAYDVKSQRERLKYWMMMSVLFHCYFLRFVMGFRKLFREKDYSRQIKNIEDQSVSINFFTYFAHNLTNILKNTHAKINPDLSKKPSIQEFFIFNIFKRTVVNELSAQMTLEPAFRRKFFESFLSSLYVMLTLNKVIAISFVLKCAFLFLLIEEIVRLNFYGFLAMATGMVIIKVRNFVLIKRTVIYFFVIPHIMGCILILIYHMSGLNIGIRKDLSVSYLMIGLSKSKAETFVSIKNHFLVIFSSLSWIQIESFLMGLKQIKRREKQLEINQDIINASKIGIHLFLKLIIYRIVFIQIISMFRIVNLGTTITLIFCINYLYSSSRKNLEHMLNALIFVYILKYITRFRIIFCTFEDHINQFFGLEFESAEGPSLIQNDFFILFFLATSLKIFHIIHFSDKIQDTFRNKHLQKLHSILTTVRGVISKVYQSSKVFVIFPVMFYISTFHKHRRAAFLKVEFFSSLFVFFCHLLFVKFFGTYKKKLYMVIFSSLFFIEIYRFMSVYLLNYQNLIFSVTGKLFDSTFDSSENFSILIICGMKLLLIATSLKAINEPEVQPFVFSKRIASILRSLFCLCREIVFLCVIFYFKNQPNTFKLLFIFVYCVHFCLLVIVLSRDLNLYQFDRILSLKIGFFKSHFMINEDQRNVNQRIVFAPDFENVSRLYKKFLSNTFFKHLHFHTKHSWLFLVISLLGYLLTLYSAKVYFGAGSLALDKLLIQVLGQVIDSQSTIEREFILILCVLGLMLFEYSCIHFLEPPKIGISSAIRKDVVKLLVTRYKILYNCEDEGLLEDLRIQLERFKGYNLEEYGLNQNLHLLITARQGLGPMTPLARIARNNRFQNEEIVNSLNQPLNKYQRTLLALQNRSKLNFMQLSEGWMALFPRLMLVPLILGLCYKPHLLFAALTPFVLVYAVLPRVHNVIGQFSIFVMLQSIAEYAVRVVDDQHMTGDYVPKFLRNMYSSSFGLNFSIGFALMVKLLLLSAIIIADKTVSLDKVDSTIFSEVTTKVIDDSRYEIIEYTSVSRKQPHFFKYKSTLFGLLPHLHFALNFLGLFYTRGKLAIIAMIGLTVFRLYFAFGLKTTLAKSLGPSSVFFYVISISSTVILIFLSVMTTLSEGSFFTITLHRYLKTHISNSWYVTLGLLLSFICYDVAVSETAQAQKQNCESYYSVLQRLSKYCLIYWTNEHQLIRNLDILTKNSLLKEKLEDYRNKTNVAGSISQDVSLIPKASSEARNLLMRLPFFKRQLVKLQLSVARYVVSQVENSHNLFSLLQSFIEKNRALIGEKDLDLFGILNGEMGEVEEMLNIVASHEEDFKSPSFPGKPDNKVDSTSVALKLIEKQIMSSESPLITSSNGSDFFRNVLGTDTLLLHIHGCSAQRFGDNFFKHTIGPKRFFVLKKFDMVRFFRNDPFSLTSLKHCLGYFYFLKEQSLVIFALITLFVFSEGLTAVPLCALLIFHTSIEPFAKSRQSWTLCYLLFMIIFATQVSLMTQFNIKEFSSSDLSKISLPPKYITVIFSIVFGQINLGFMITIFLLFELLLRKLDSFGVENSIRIYESLPQAIFRIFRNSELDNIYSKSAALVLSELNFIERVIKRTIPKTTSQKDIESLNFELAISKSSLFRSVIREEPTFVTQASAFAKIIKSDRLLIEPEKFSSYLWRNFSYYQRKSGIDISFFCMTVLIVILLYFVLFYRQLTAGTKSFLEAIKKNEMTPTMAINISILIFSICMEKRLTSIVNLAWVNSFSHEKESVINVLKAHALLDFTPIKALNTLQAKARRAFNKLKIIKLLSPSKKSRLDFGYRSNPLLNRLRFTILLWVYGVFLCFFLIPFAGTRSLSPTATFTDALFCNDMFANSFDVTHPSMKCNQYANNSYIRGLFFLFCIYALTSVLQMKFGFIPNQKYEQPKFDRIMDKIPFQIYKNAPFIRELRTILEYSASLTSLNLMQWFKVEDIECTVNSAIINGPALRHPGRTQNRTVRIIGAVLLIAFLFLIISPLYLFSDILPAGANDEIASGSVSLSAMLPKGSQLLFQSSRFQKENVTPNSSLANDLKNINFLKKYDSDLFRVVSFRRFSDSYYDVTPESQEILKDSPISIELSFSFKTVYRRSANFKHSFPLTSYNSKMLNLLLTTPKCYVSGFHIALPELSQIIYLQADKAKPNLVPEVSIIPVLKHHCESLTGKAYFELTDFESNPFRMILLVERVKNSLEMLQKLSKNSELSLLGIYALIFSYLGLTIIRKALLDQTHKIWTTEIPNGEKLQEFLLMIKFAREQGDLYLEEILFSRLIDLFRAPEKIRSLTGPLSEFAFEKIREG